MGTALAARIALTCSHRPPGAPLGQRVDYLTAQARQPGGASHRDQVARAAGVMNFAALIASDTGIPELAAELCWRQHAIFADAGTLPPDIAVIALMPLVNISRQQARQGDGNTAFSTLNCLYRAAQQRGTATVHGHRVNLAPLTCGPAHRETCRELWTVLLTDGARALAGEGRWTDAAAQPVRTAPTPAVIFLKDALLRVLSNSVPTACTVRQWPPAYRRDGRRLCIRRAARTSSRPRSPSPLS
jgi:hypothetical protein